MPESRLCADCGAALLPRDPQPLCAPCIFRRLARTGSTAGWPAERFLVGQQTATAAAAGAWDEGNDPDFHADYELMAEIGRGSMGTVYQAHQPGSGRRVALKVIHEGVLKGDWNVRRVRAVTAEVAPLSHPHLVRVLALGRMDGSPCISMEYYPGGNLAERLAGVGMPLREAVAALMNVGRALQVAHEHGVLHRALKLSNILLDAAGQPHLGDFGLGLNLGAPTVAADIEGLGAILVPIIRGGGQRGRRGVGPVGGVVGAVDRELEAVCWRCGTVELAERYRSAGAFADELERWLRRQPVVAPQVPDRPPSGRDLRGG